jgi:hypothetical protein
MITDSQLNFVPMQAPLSLVAAAGIAIPSAILDLLGSGVGTAPANIIGAASVFGMDAGVGSHRRPELACSIGVAAVTANAATLNLALQAAVDTGSGGGYVPGTWTTIVETGPIAAASLTAGQPIGRFPLLPAFPANLNPRFLRLLFQVAAATNFTAGTIAYALMTWVRDDQANKFAAKGFSVA